ncbi:tandem-95 repeat protein, partial [Oleiphilus sp. HI0067]|uniref:tandem-95 repeat protein n=1 Tax=Oleiphilus sp. HI0067 TaxID=1822243 RepID=UPI000A436740
QLLAQASDVDGDTLTALNLQTANPELTITDNGDGTFTLTPAANFNGDLDISFDIFDGEATVAANIDLTVNPVNDLPVAQDQNFQMNEDGTITLTDGDLLAGASDVDGDTLSISDVTYTGTDGIFTDNGDDTYTFAPNENFNGNVTVDFTVSDGQGGTDTAQANIVVVPVNDPPVAGDTSFSMNEDGTITLTPAQLLANSSDVEGDVSLQGVSYSGSDGTLSENDDGSFSFIPNENFNGDIVLDVVVLDAEGASDTAQANIVVVPVNDFPVSGNLAYAIDEDGSITLSQEQLLAQASDVDGDTLTALNLQTANPELTITDNGDGTFTLTPAANFNGDLDISFDVFDGEATVAANIDLTVNPVNDLPVAQDQNFQMNEDGTITLTDGDLLAGASDVDGDTLSISDVTYTGTDGIFTDNGDDTYTFAPNENFNGNVTVDFTVSDGQGGTDTAQANIVVVPVNDPPVSGNLAYAIDEDGSITLSQEQLLAQASDVDGDTLTALNLQTANPELTITDNGDGTFTLTPAANFNGDLDISFDVFDGEATVAANIDLTVNPVNDLPVAQDQNFQMNEDGTITLTDGDLLAGASDVDGDTLSISDVAYTGTDGIFTDNG